MELKLKNNLNTDMRIRLSKEEKEYLKEEAKKRNMTLTDLVKIALNEYLK